MNFLQDMKESVVNFEHYNIIRKKSYKSVFAYLAILVLLVFSIGSVRTWLELNKRISNVEEKFKTSVTDFSISDGVLNWDGNPLLHIVDERGTLFAVDLNNSISSTELNSKKYSSYMIFYKTGFSSKNSSAVQKFTYKEFGTDIQSKINKTSILSFLNKLKGYVLPVLIFILPFVYAFKLLNVVVLAAIAMLIGTSMGTKMSWKEYFLISGYALTLPMLIGLLFELSNLRVHWIVYWLISFVYIIMAMRAYKPDKIEI